MDRQALTADLIEDFGYSTPAAQVAAGRLLGSGPEVRRAFQSLRMTGAPPTLCIAGYTVERLAREHGMYPVAALLTLDWLMQEPEKATASLRKGHDHVAVYPSRA